MGIFGKSFINSACACTCAKIIAINKESKKTGKGISLSNQSACLFANPLLSKE